MDKYSRLKKKILNREQVLGTNITIINSPPLIQLINEDYLDYVLFDMEHGIFNNENIIGALQTCRLIGLPSFVRVPQINYHHISRCLDMGADGIMLPRVETVEQVADAVKFMRFPPIGMKGFGGYQNLRKGETLQDFQTNRHLLIQIESSLGISNLNEMLEKYGDEIAAVVIGPYDLSISLGIERQFDNPILLNAIQDVIDTCVKHNKSVGIFCDNNQIANYWKERGANFLWMCTDNQLYLAGMRSIIKPMAE